MPTRPDSSRFAQAFGDPLFYSSEERFSGAESGVASRQIVESVPGRGDLHAAVFKSRTSARSSVVNPLKPFAIARGFAAPRRTPRAKLSRTVGWT